MAMDFYTLRRGPDRVTYFKVPATRIKWAKETLALATDIANTSDKTGVDFQVADQAEKALANLVGLIDPPSEPVPAEA